MRVLHVASEVAPFAQSGGLADVVAGLPAALAESHGARRRRCSCRCTAASPTELAAAGDRARRRARRSRSTSAPHRSRPRSGSRASAASRYGFVDCPPLYDRAGTLYGPGGAGEFGDNHVRFAALGKAALAAGDALLGGAARRAARPRLAGRARRDLRAARAARRPRSSATIHNLAYRGIFPKTAMTELGIPWSMFTIAPARVLRSGVACLKGGLALADAVTTVSPSYAREILTPERGEALDGFLRWDVKRLVGIVNGIDTTAWDPATDPRCRRRSRATSSPARRRAARALAAELGLAARRRRAADRRDRADDRSEGPRSGRRDRARARSGSARGWSCSAPASPTLEAAVSLARRRVPRARRGADRLRRRAVAHRIYAGCDLFAMPSRFEPCGLGQLYAMRYGTIPIVHAVGGLRDTVIDPGDASSRSAAAPASGSTPATALALADALERAIARCSAIPPRCAHVRRAAMARDSSWTASAQQYVQLYRSLRRDARRDVRRVTDGTTSDSCRTVCAGHERPALGRVRPRSDRCRPACGLDVRDGLHRSDGRPSRDATAL